MPWQAKLELNYLRQDGGKTYVQASHDGPLRVLKSHFPEGPAVCHNVIVHPPGGIVEGDTLDVAVRVAEGAHAFISTPGATRFYASDNVPGQQLVRLKVENRARLEWLPLETIAYSGCFGHNHLEIELAEGAEIMAWDVTALGLPAAGQAYERGRFHQRMSLGKLWLEEGWLDATDSRLLNSPVGLNGQRSLGTMVLASGSTLGRDRMEHLLEAARSVQASADIVVGCTSPNGQMIVIRALAPVVEPLMAYFQAVWAQLRPAAWDMPASSARIWHV
ncbi:urease accessory protein UreD [Hydrogenophaga sp. 5NK40-0174]|uniref:urease accessory protein UreD n=1 Tax=Hydrogenophaga sp. 5NK40-0174 TaxID=3127649 RepID=UPI00310607A1